MGMAKSLGVSPDYVLAMTYENFLLYGYATPTYDFEERKKEEEWDESLDASNPENFKSRRSGNEEEFIKAI